MAAAARARALCRHAAIASPSCSAAYEYCGDDNKPRHTTVRVPVGGIEYDAEFMDEVDSDNVLLRYNEFAVFRHELICPLFLVELTLKRKPPTNQQ